jgi:toxin-antitoxin system PIN domain toxin
MTAFLLDVNVLIALCWRGHPHHAVVSKWFSRHGSHRWATCPFTQVAFVRIVSDPVFSVHAASPTEAVMLLKANVEHVGHQFWPDDITLVEAIGEFRSRLVGHQQVSDAYLLGLAFRKKAKLATLDRGILDLLHPEATHRESVELLGE